MRSTSFDEFAPRTLLPTNQVTDLGRNLLELQHRRFFEQDEDPILSWRAESDEDRAERERLTTLGGWAGG